MINGNREQVPTPPNAWLYQDESEDVRNFYSRFTHWDENDPDLPECTQAEREQWEHDHQPQPEPEQ